MSGPGAYDSLRPVAWAGDHLKLLDQRRLPGVYTHLELDSAEAVTQAIRDMVVRGAPAIGIAAAYGVVLAARRAYAEVGEDWRGAVEPLLQRLAQARPTAVNLAWAVQRMRAVAVGLGGDPEPALLAEAHAILAEDIAANQRMGELGAALLPTGGGVLTHCNAGALATGGYGTALGVVRSAYAAGKISTVYADETRPWLQGARLTAWELINDEIPVTLLADCAAASLMRSGAVAWVIVGADRVAANGDVANKIGTYGLAVLARRHGVKFMVVAPLSSLDYGLEHGDLIEIETRAEVELLEAGACRVAAAGAHAWNPVFDVTPAELVDVLVTERGVVERPDRAKLASLRG